MFAFAIFVVLLSVTADALDNNALKETILQLQQTQFKSTNAQKRLLPEAGLTIDELAKYYNFPSETHEVVTEDGYILQLQRIPHGVNNSEVVVDKKVILLMPGLLSNAGFYLSNGEKNSLGFWLANQGYDVWIANYRGSTQSRKHLSLDPDSDKSSYWDFSFDEIGYYDIPACIDYILATTNQQKIFYLGHSQGNTAFFAMAAQRPEYNEKIRLMVALAPIAFISNLDHPVLKILVQSKDILELIATTLSFYEVLPHWDFLTTFGAELCSDGMETQEICASLMKLASGVNEKELNRTLIPLILTHVPSGSSMKQLLHYAQEILSGHFRKYDYGIIRNLLKYGSATPPDYVIENITAPIALFYSLNDWFANVIDVGLLSEKLPNLVHQHVVEDEEFSHMAFGLGVNAVDLVYEKVLDVLEKF